MLFAAPDCRARQKPCRSLRTTTLAAMNSQPGRPHAPPLWVRWILAIVVAAALLAGVVIATTRAGPEGPTSEAGAEAEINRIADITITKDQAPHFASFAAGSTPTSALDRAIEGDVRRRIAGQQLTGPLHRVICRATSASSSGRVPYRCTARSAGIEYPFLAVVDERRQRLTWCKVDPPAVADAGPEIPVSVRCRA
jgi:hypothetical protein